MISIRAFIALLGVFTVFCVNAKQYYVDGDNPSAADENKGTELQPFKTISAAAKLAGAGDQVLVKAGIYREHVAPVKGGEKGKPVEYIALEPGEVIVRGSDIWTPKWSKYNKAPGIYQADIDPAMFKGHNPFITGISIASKDAEPVARPTESEILPYTLGQIFCNGKPMLQTLNINAVLRTPNTWIVSADGKKVIAHFPGDGNIPADGVLEISTRDRIFSPVHRGLGYIHVKGFVFEHCCNQGPFPQGGAVSVRSGKNWLIENNTIRYAKMIGLDCGSETWGTTLLKNTVEKEKRIMIGGRHVIRNNTITDNGLCGIAGWNHKGTQITGNLIERNNRLSITKAEGRWEEWGGIKLHGSDALIEGNLIRFNGAHGVWIDNGYKNARITRNVIVGNCGSGVFLELGAGRCLIDNNIIAHTAPFGHFYAGFGVYTHDASDVVVAHNLIIDNFGAGVYFRKISKRTFGGKQTEASNEKVYNNIFKGNDCGVAMPYPNKFSQGCASDYNLFPEDKPKFRYVGWTYGQPSSDKMEKEIKAKFTEKNRDAFISWKQNKMMMHDIWSAVTGWDTNSMVGKGVLAINFKQFEPSIKIALKSSKIIEMKCKPVEGVTTDFNGNEIVAGKIFPGPFQKLYVGNNNYFTLWPLPTTVIDLPDTATNIVEQNPGKWFAAKQNGKSPELDSPLDSYSPLGSKILLHAKSTGGVQKSPASVIMFNVPETASFQLKFDSKLTRRIAKTAGYSRLQIYRLAADSSSELIETVRLNTEGGYGKYPDSYSIDKKIDLKKSDNLIIRFQVVSPGPAPGGHASMKIENLQLTSIQ